MTALFLCRAAHPSTQRRWLLLLGRAKRDPCVERAEKNPAVQPVPTQLLLVKQMMLLAMRQTTATLPLQAKLLAQVIHFVLQDFDSEPAKRRLARLSPVQAMQRDLFLPQGTLQEQQPQPETDSPVPRVRARQCLRCPAPFAFFRETLVAQKCSHAARFGDSPIRAQCRRPRNPGELAACDSKCSHWPRKRVRRARTFLIAVADRCPCLPRLIAD